MDKKLLTVAEAATILGVSRSLLYTLVMRNEIKSIQLGRARRIPSSAIDDFIDRLMGESAAKRAPR